MKKDKKFLIDLEKNLDIISNKKRTNIILKYENIIKNEREQGKSIKKILSDLGDPIEIANKEISEIKSSAFINKIKNTYNKIVSFLTREITFKKTKSKSKKIKNKFRVIIKKFRNKFNIIIKKNKNKFRKKTKNYKKDNKKNAFNNLSKTNKILINISLIILLVVFLWLLVVLISSLFAILDGIKFYSVSILLFGIVLLVFILIVFIYSFSYGIKISKKIFNISIFVSIFLIAFGISYLLKQYFNIKSIEDVSEKYTMVTEYKTYNISSKGKIYTITFNSNYKTKYRIEYDDTLENQIKVEIKYYEAYYDYYSKETSNNLYISLKLDKRDRISVYLDDLKENKVFDPDELSRYTVRIIMNKADKERIIID